MMKVSVTIHIQRHLLLPKLSTEVVDIRVVMNPKSNNGEETFFVLTTCDDGYKAL